MSRRALYAPPDEAHEGGMILAVHYSHSGTTFKMTAFLPALYPDELRALNLTVLDPGASSIGQAKRTSSCEIQADYVWGCTFRLNNVPPGQYDYSVTYAPGNGRIDQYTGVIPAPVADPRMAAMGCFGFDDTKDKSALVRAVLSTNPDIIVLHGDQTYQHEELQYGFLETAYTLHVLTRDRPTITLIDDHDYGLSNIWGAGEEDELSGSGFISPCEISAMERLQLSHNPDPARPDLVLRNDNIRAYFTEYMYGDSISIAILESRKFKQNLGGSGCGASEAQRNGSLLGTAQEEWLRSWTRSRASRIKVVISESSSAALITSRTSFDSAHGNFPHYSSYCKVANSDFNSYPKAGFARYMDILNRGGVDLLLGGDQHLGMAVRYPQYNWSNGVGIFECGSGAAINDIWWRVNEEQVGGIHEERWGETTYELLAVWNVDKSLRDTSRGIVPLPFQRQYSNAEKHMRADSFLSVDIRTSSRNFTCEAY
eukprot:3285723-Prymnesium_polylepis.1